MVQYQDTYTPGMSRMQDWSTEITPPEQRRHPAMVGTEPGRKVAEMTGPAGMTGMMERNRSTAISGPTVVTPPELADMKNSMSMDAIHAPSSREEAYLGSWKAMLSRYVGSYVVATFLVGTQNTVAWEGILFDVGNDYITIYQEARDRYIVTDYYSLKFVEFYDVQRRAECNRLLAEQDYGMTSRD